jgi:hypothetical protein
MGFCKVFISPIASKSIVEKQDVKIEKNFAVIHIKVRILRMKKQNILERSKTFREPYLF